MKIVYNIIELNRDQNQSISEESDSVSTHTHIHKRILIDAIHLGHVFIEEC